MVNDLLYSLDRLQLISDRVIELCEVCDICDTINGYNMFYVPIDQLYVLGNHCLYNVLLRRTV